ncbi:tyrosine-type recombinase/integrase [Pseudomonas sp. C11]|uniref:tyrosine-type recombinase/integrase n=1 Tax=Pseudomonas sp. C11 TaxID=3075550 RepID=UPI002AFDD294|nr:tyrosine-type recombinase/integrase [Pseudomonas sp. C11]
MSELPTIEKVRIANFLIACPTTEAGAPLFPSTLWSSVKVATYYWRPIPDSAITQYPHMPVLLESNGSIWVHGCLYLLNRAIDPLRNEPLAPATLDSLARDLRIFREALDSVNCDYLLDSEYQSRRPTYRLKAALKKKIDDGYAISSANRILSTVKSFYSWLIDSKLATFKFGLWRARKSNVRTVNDQGYTFYKTIELTDLTFRNIKQSEEMSSDSIHDGGKLHPITFAEQREIAIALSELQNPEMTLGILLALMTGARIQSVFTLRIGEFSNEKVQDTDSVPIEIGRHGADSKRSKSYPLYVPGWLYNRIRLYIGSTRALGRRQLSTNIYSDTQDQYLFLTTSGNPYYMRRSDPDIYSSKEPVRGGAVRKFINDQLIPHLASKGLGIRFTFHDLRASFGMNLVRDGIRDIENGLQSMDGLLHYVMTRMGHKSIKVTMRYLNHDYARAASYRAQSGWEKEVAKLTEIGFHQGHLDEDHDNGIDEN